jgi:hypothetical protein
MGRTVDARSWRARLVDLLPERLARATRAVRRRAGRLAALTRPAPPTPPRPEPPSTPVRLLVGPANFAGQGHAWASAARRELDGVGVRVFAAQWGAYRFPTDYEVSLAAYRNPRWQHEQRAWVERFSHVLIDGMRPVLGPVRGNDVAHDLRVLRRAGVRVALAGHGSEVRLPSRHAARVEWSPFARPDDVVRELERRARRNAEIVAGFDGPVYVSTPDLLVDLPTARWLPVVVDPATWATTRTVLQRERPVVAHAPSNARMKGSDVVDAVMSRLEAEGLVEYRRVTGVERVDMPALMAGTDIYLEQFALGLYSVTACEAMAAGCAVVGYVGDQVRDHVRAVTGREVPVVEADPTTLEETVRRLVEDRAEAARAAEAGPDFVRNVHDGRLSAHVLEEWLGAH